MALLAPDRSPPRPRSRIGGLARLVAIAALMVVGIVALLNVAPSLNPFREQTHDRSQPVLLKSLESLSQYHAATANMQVVVDVERDTKLVPSWLKGERTLFVAAGSVDAAVDFSAIGRDGDAVRVSDGRRAVTLTLPPPFLTEPRLDASRSRVFDRDRGVIDRIGDALGDNPVNDQSVMVFAERKLREAAAADPGLRRTAERNTRSMLEGMLRGLGFDRVHVRFRAVRV
jgi:Protein of unknown function (DUF4230)